MKKIIALALTLIMGAGVLTGCGSDGQGEATGSSGQIYRTADEIKESGEIRIGVFSDKKPFGYVDEYGNYQGYDIYFAERIAQDLGVELEYV